MEPIEDEGMLDEEPVRLPVWLATVLVAAINLAIDLLSDVSWRAALIGLLVTVGGLFGAGEVARSHAWSGRSVRVAKRDAHGEGYELALDDVRRLDS